MNKLMKYIFLSLMLLMSILPNAVFCQVIKIDSPVKGDVEQEVELVIVFRDAATLTRGELKAALRATELGFSTPSNAALWKLPLPLQGRLRDRPFSIRSISDAVGLISEQAIVASVCYNAPTLPLEFMEQGNPLYRTSSPIFDVSGVPTNSPSCSDVFCKREIPTSGMKIAVLDTGNDPNTANSSIDRNSARSVIDTDPRDSHGHSTAILSILERVTPANTLIPIKVANSRGYGSVFSLIKGIDAVTQMAASVKIVAINISMIAKINAGEHSAKTPMECALDLANNKGIAVIVAAGNTSTDLDLNSHLLYTQRVIFEPAMSRNDNVICVGAVLCNDAKADFSNKGRLSTDIFAPGVNVKIRSLTNTVAYASGTSFSAPIVTGLISQRATQLNLQNPDCGRLKNDILGSARVVNNLIGLCITGGVLDAQKVCSLSVVTVSPPNSSSIAKIVSNKLTIFPNPTTSQATIAFKLEKDHQSVSLDVYDMQGRLMHNLLPQNALSKGEYKINFDKILRGGIYFCQLRTDTEIQTTKLIVNE